MSNHIQGLWSLAMRADVSHNLDCQSYEHEDKGFHTLGLKHQLHSCLYSRGA